MKDPFCTMYIVRHGQSRANIPNLYGTDTELTDKGRQQVKNLAKVLQKIHFDAIISSPLIRARQTAEILALERKISVQVRELLKEKYYGCLEPRVVKEVKEELKELFEKRRKVHFEEWKKVKLVPDAESDEESIERFIYELREIAVAYDNKTVLISSHINLMKLLLIQLGLFEHRQIEGQSLENAGYIKLRCDGKYFSIDEIKGLRVK